MGQFLFIILCVTLGYVAYKHAGAVRSDGSALCRKIAMNVRENAGL